MGFGAHVPSRDSVYKYHRSNFVSCLGIEQRGSDSQVTRYGVANAVRALLCQ